MSRYRTERSAITYKLRVAMAKRYAKSGQWTKRGVEGKRGLCKLHPSLAWSHPGDSEDWLIAIEMVKLIKEIDNEQ